MGWDGETRYACRILQRKPLGYRRMRRIKVKVKSVPMILIDHHAMMAYWGMEV
jgi:hypothetical protein